MRRRKHARTGLNMYTRLSTTCPSHRSPSTPVACIRITVAASNSNDNKNNSYLVVIMMVITGCAKQHGQAPSLILLTAEASSAGCRAKLSA